MHDSGSNPKCTKCTNFRDHADPFENEIELVDVYLSTIMLHRLLTATGKDRVTCGDIGAETLGMQWLIRSCDGRSSTYTSTTRNIPNRRCFNLSIWRLALVFWF
jgi:hypothetical protein